jgi:streptogramin lyase
MRQYLIVMSFCAAVLSGCTCGEPPEVKPPWDNQPPATDGGRDGGGGNTGSDGGTTFDPDAGTTIRGRPDGGFPPDAGTGPLTGGDNVQVDPEGNIVLGGGRTELAFAWIANNDQNTVSKFDTRTGREVGRYHTAIPIDGRPKPDGTIGYPNGLRGNEGNNPSRTAVDLYGDVWVANRAASTQGSVTKIFNSKQFCIDRNRNGTIDTSEDRNNDGAISTNPADREMIFPTNWDDPVQYDECIAFSTPVGPPGSGTIKARAMAISAGLEGSPGDVWVGVHNENSVVKLDPFTGQQVPVNAAGQMRIVLPFGPYGAAIDSQQRLWVVSSGLTPARLALIDTNAGTLIRADLVPPTTSGAYGIAVDGQDRAWVAGWSAGAKAFRYTHPRGTGPGPGTWQEFDFSNAVSQINTRIRRGRGIAADDQGFIWMSSDLNTNNTTAAQLIAFNGDTGAIKRFNYPGVGMVDFIDATDGATAQSIGVGLDTDGHAWVNNRSGNAMRIHRETGEILRTARQGAGLYTYSDFTGYQLRNFTAPLGSFRQTFSSPCGADTVWRYLRWDAEIPPRTSIQAFVTASNDQNELTNPLLKKGPFTSSPADLRAAGVPKGTYLRVEFVLRSEDRQSQLSPKLKSFDVNYECEIIIQ